MPSNYEAIPFDPSPERAETVSKILREMLSQESLWVDPLGACDDLCGECPRCQRRIAAIVAALSDPSSRAWEVWNVDGPANLVGVIYLTHTVAGCDAIAHYSFFDGRLRDKEPLLRAMLAQVAGDYHRLTAEVPTYAHALLRHAKRLGFTEEGVKREARRWRGKWWDLHILGLLSEEIDDDDGRDNDAAAGDGDEG